MSQPLIPDAAVQAIKDSVVTATIDVAASSYTTRPVFLPPADPTPDALELHTLSGLVDYLDHNIDGLVVDQLAIMVESPDRVSLISRLAGRALQRHTLVEVTFDGNNFLYDRFMSIEDFNIALQTKFIQNEQRAAVLKVTGNIKEETIGEYGDDGVSQTVTAKAGIARVAEVQVPNPVWLAPYRTFADVAQPISPFVLRMQRHDGRMPTVALFECDGGLWKQEAIENIARSLRIKIAELSEPMSKIAILA